MAKIKELNNNVVEDMDLELGNDLDLDDDLFSDLDNDFDLDLDNDFDFDLEEEEEVKPEPKKETKKVSDPVLDEDDFDLDLDNDLDDLTLDFDDEDEVEEVKPEPKKETKKVSEPEEDELEFDEEEIELPEDDFDLDFEDEVEEVKPEPKKEVKVKPEPKKEVKKEVKKTPAKADAKKKVEPKVETKKEQLEEVVTNSPSLDYLSKLQLVVDPKTYEDTFNKIVMTKVNSYNKTLKDRREGKTTRMPVSKAISRSDFAPLMKAKMYSETDYMKTFVKLLVSAGLDRDDAVRVLVKDKISRKVFEELYQLSVDTIEDILRAEGVVLLFNKDDLRATLEGEYVEEEVRSIAHLKKSKFTHIRKGNYYKVKCRSRVLESKVEKGYMDEKGNFVLGEEE